ncbi:uncharacterized protein LOC108625315 [Ceratina calcarata]|uniref:Gustatory receptor n=1 Tax=Ceratina calcarata TaxID=156304 RepID=A0AAJ7IYZ8_9HYME|nr:uncharacterized protein LOC108625315 [Ceratina calcarata]
MSVFKKELASYPRTGFPLKVQVKPFDVETTYTELTQKKAENRTKYHGPDSPLYAAIYPLVFITRLLGLAPYDFTADRMTPSDVLLAFSFACIIIYCYIMYLVYMRFSSIAKVRSLLRVVEIAKVAVNFSVAIFDLITTIFTRRAFCRVWNGIQDFDDRLSQLGYPRKETRTVIAVWSLITGQTVIWTLINQSGMYAFSETWQYNVCYMIVYVGTGASVYKFVGMIIFLGQRFRQLNRIARENLPPRIGYSSSNVSRKTVQDLHNKLMLCSEAFGSLSSWSLLFWLGSLCMHSVINIYFFIDWMILTAWSDFTYRLVFNMWCWLIGFSTQLLAIHFACDYTITEANSMGAILIEWDARTIRKFPQDDTIRTSLHFLNRRLHFSAGGLCDVDLSLLTSIVSQVSKYLMLLLQFPA